MMKKNKASLDEFMQLTNTISTDDFFYSLISFCKENLECDGGGLFFYSSATDKLELVLHSEYRDKRSISFPLKIGEGVAGEAFQENCIKIRGREYSRKRCVDAVIFPKEEIRATVGIPIKMIDKPFGVICLFYFKKTASHRHEDSLSESEETIVRYFFESENFLKIEKYIHNLRLNQIIHDLKSVGEGPSRLAHKVSKYISKLQKTFRGNNFESPPLIAVQLVDHQHKKIRAFQSVGMPLGYVFTRSIPFESEDIHSFILKTRKIEVITGNDERRFDQEVFEKYSHNQYVRLFMPLFPYQFNDLRNKSKELMPEQMVKNLLEFKEKKESQRLIFDWKKGRKPSRSLTYGTLEIGYLKNDSNSNDISPFNEEYVYWIVGKAFELGIPLYSATLSGVLEKIGRLAGSVPGVKLKSFKCDFRYRDVCGVRTYPIRDGDPAATARLTPIEDKRKTRKNNAEWTFDDYKPVTLIYKNDFSGKKLAQQKNISKSLRKFLNSVSKNSAQAVDVAQRLNAGAILAHDFLQKIETEGNVGTIHPDKVIQSICKEAIFISGAKECKFYMFEKKPESLSPFKDSDFWRIGQPAFFPEKMDNKYLVDSEVALARTVAYKKEPLYINYDQNSLDFKFPLCFLPLDLFDGSVGVLILFFSKEYTFSDKKKLRLEERVIRWIARISSRSLLLRRRFSNLMMQLRNDIQVIKNKLGNKNELPKRRLSIFLEELLIKFIKRLDAYAVAVTMYYEPKTGPTRLYRYICCRDREKKKIFPVYNNQFLNTVLEGPCFEACITKKIFVRDPSSKNKKVHKVVREIEMAAEKCQKNNIEAKTLCLFADYLKLENDPTTLLTFPISNWAYDKTERKAAVTIVLPGTHVFDFFHRQLIVEIGGLLTETIRHIRSLDRQESESRHIEQFEKRRVQFEKAKHPDDIIGILLRGMGSKTIINESDRWGLADNIVIWNLDWGRNELIYRSSRGLWHHFVQSQSQFTIIDMMSHPIFEREEIVFSRKKPPKLKKRFNLWTFWIEESSKKNDLCRTYKENIGDKLLISFPIVDAADRIHGVMDILRSEPFHPEEEKVLKRLLYRLSRQLCDAVDKCQKKRVKSITDDLYATAESSLRNFQTNHVYEKIVFTMKDEFRCEHCDLFLETEGKMLLHTTTRIYGPKLDEERFKFWLNPDDLKKEFLGGCLSGAKPSMHHESDDSDTGSNMSEKLHDLVGIDYRYERLSYPLMAIAHNKSIIIGLLHLRGPIKNKVKKLRATDKKVYIKKSTVFNFEEFLIGKKLCISIQRIIQMANLVEKQAWLVNEMAHSMGQPLQILRIYVHDVLRHLPWDDDSIKADLKQYKDKIYNSFDLTLEAKEHIGFLSRKRRKETDFQFKNGDLSALLRNCCDLLSKKSLQYDNRIVYSKVNTLDILPFHNDLMKKVFINLLDNAIKYSWKGKYIDIVAFENQSEICIQFINIGIGIPKEQINRILEPYFRSRIPDAKGKRPGTGIGLAIAREVVEEIHEGKIEVESKSLGKPIYSTDSEFKNAIENIPHKTTITVILNRKKLELLNYRKGNRGE